MKEMQKKLMDKISAVLSPNQKAKFKAMLGKPFEFKMPMGPGGPPPGGQGGPGGFGGPGGGI